MNCVRLELNPDKTEFIITGDKHTKESLIAKFLVTFVQSSTTSEVEVKNLGVTFDLGNTLDSHVGKVCLACYYHLRDLRCICEFLTVDTAFLVANAMVSSQLEYSNSLLYEVSRGSVAKLQKAQYVLCPTFSDWTK